MASLFSFHLALALLLVLVHQQAAEEENNYDLDKAIAEYLEGLRKRQAHPFWTATAVNLDWWDTTKERQEVRDEFGDREPFNVTAGDVKYYPQWKSSREPIIVYTQWVYNKQPSSSENVTVEKDFERRTTATWHVEKGFSYSKSQTATASVDFINKDEIRIDLKLGSRNEVSETETFSLNQGVIVPPMKSVKIKWVITHTVEESYWQSTVTVTGNIFASYSNDLFSFVPVRSDLYYFNLAHLKKRGLFRKIKGITYEYDCHGVFKKVRADRGEIEVNEYDIHVNGGRSSAVRTYTIPLSMTPYSPTAKTP